MEEKKGRKRRKGMEGIAEGKEIQGIGREEV